MGAVAMEEREGRADAREDDGALVRATRQDPQGPAFRALYERHRRDVFRFLLGLVRENALAEDLLQDTFLRVFERLTRFDDGRELRPWLFAIARNLALNAIRARRKKERAGGDVPDPAASDRIPARVADREATDRARAALATLDDDDRALLVQRIGLGQKVQDLAASYECTERTVRNRLDAAVDRLTAALLNTPGGAS